MACEGEQVGEFADGGEADSADEFHRVAAVEAAEVEFGGWANREKLCTHITRSSLYSRRKASTAGLEDDNSVKEPRPNAGFCLRISIMRRVQCSSEDGDDIDASTFATG